MRRGLQNRMRSVSSAAPSNDFAPGQDDVKRLSPLKQTSKQHTFDARNWERVFGIKLGSVADQNEVTSRYRGGFHITSVVADSPAQKAGIQAADILIGIGLWETVSQENLAFLFNEVTHSPDKNLVKFYILRKGQTIWGHLTIPSLRSWKSFANSEVDQLNPHVSVNLLAEHLQLVDRPEQAEFSGLLNLDMASFCAGRECQFGDRGRAFSGQDWL